MPRQVRDFEVPQVSMVALTLLALALATGCSSTPKLMPTPNVLLRDTNAFVRVPAALQTNVVDLLYVTDRQPEQDKKGCLTYGYQRSASLGFGQCSVSIGKQLSWETLRRNSLSAKRDVRLPLICQGVRELGRFPETPMMLITNQGLLTLDADAGRAIASAGSALQREIQRRLEVTPRKEVFVFVHGFNNDFPWVTALTAQLWHFLQREGVPITYTWPAGRGGLRGYTYDRESGEFTIYHLKQFLTTLLECPGIERVHLLAHSRGTDVLTSALREIIIRERGHSQHAIRLDRVANLILIAPDLDAQVASQRLGAEHLELAVDRLTLYVCSEDRAITFANWLFEGVRRLGILRESDLSEEHRAFLRHYRNVQFIDARVKAGFLSHGYFYSNPAVSSDLLMLLRENCDAGTPECRPLAGDGDPFWRLTEGYPGK